MHSLSSVLHRADRSRTDRDRRRLLDEALVLEPVSPQVWRVCDARVPRDEHGHLLGFVEARKDRFEVMQLGDGFTWNTFDTMRQALDHIVLTSHAVVAANLQSDLEWVR